MIIVTGESLEETKTHIFVLKQFFVSKILTFM